MVPQPTTNTHGRFSPLDKLECRGGRSWLTKHPVPSGRSIFRGAAASLPCLLLLCGLILLGGFFFPRFFRWLCRFVARRLAEFQSRGHCIGSIAVLLDRI